MRVFLTNQTPAAVLLDVPPPYALHWQRCCLLQQRLPELPLLLLTTDPTALADLPGNDGRVPILTKPFDIETLLAAVQQLVRTRPT